MKKIFLFLVLGTLLYLGHRFYTTPTTIIPYPYIIKQAKWPDQKDASQAQVLILGDRLAKKLDQYIPLIQEKSSKNLKDPLRIFNWAKKNEGLHRSLAKLKSLEKLPPVIIYHGSSQETFEKKFALKDRRKIINNIEKYHDESTISLILTFPILSRFLYQKVKYYPMGNTPQKMSREYNSTNFQILMELTYKLFELELEEIIDYVQSKGSKLILVSSPINLDSNPQKVCENTTSSTLEQRLLYIKDIIKKGDHKSALNHLKDLQKISIGNARVLYLYGQTAKKLGRISDARDLLHKAAIFDCKAWRSNLVFNSIIRNYAKKKNQILVDFEWEVNKHYGQNILFFDQIYPQEIFYQKISNILARSIGKVLHI